MQSKVVEHSYEEETTSLSYQKSPCGSVSQTLKDAIKNEQ